MKVLLISAKTKESKGGIAVWTEHYLSGCEKCDIICDVVNTATIGQRAVNTSSKRNFKEELVRTKKINNQLNTYLKNNEYDIAHLNTSIGIFGIIRDYYLAKKIAKKNIPLIVQFHCDILHWITNNIVKLYLKKLLKISNTNFVLCENSHKYLKEVFGAESVKVPNFIDESLIAKEKQINKDVSKIFFTGRVSLLKGAKEIYELANKFPNITFELVGEVSNEVAVWEKPNNIKLLGLLPYQEVISQLDNSDIFLFPSYTEGFSMALAESMARGIPSVATDVGANMDMLENKGGFITNVGDIDAMNLALQSLMEFPVRSKMSNWCINKVKNHYTTIKVMNLFCEYYKKLM